MRRSDPGSRLPCLSNQYMLAILSGILIGTSYIPFPPWAMFFCFVPLWSAWLKATNAKQVFCTGWFTQFVLTLIGFNWVAYTVHEFGHLPWPLAVITLLLFCSFANLHVPLAGLAWYFFVRRLKIRPFGQMLALPIFIGLGERLFPMIFDWHFGYVWLWAKFPAYHLADIIGFMGLSHITAFFNFGVLLALTYPPRSKQMLRVLIILVASFVTLNGLGYWRSTQLPTPDQNKKFLIVQANIGNQEKLMAEQGWGFRDIVFERFVRLSEAGVKEHAPDFVVWPETAFPDWILDPHLRSGFAAQLGDFIRTMNTRFLIGAYSQVKSQGKIGNSFFALDTDGRWMDDPYHKTVLLAFGEYIPGGEWFPILYRWLPQVGRFGRGPGPVAIHAGDLKVGPQICYEGLFDWFTRGLALKSAQVLVNVTNDSWYGTWQQPYQHLYMTFARAIEVRLPLVRSTNTGISGVILADGTIKELSPLAKEWYHAYEVPFVTNPQPTAFVSWGFFVVPALLILGFLGIGIWNREVT